MSKQYVEAIRSCPLFSTLTAYGAQVVLDSGKVKQHDAGDVIFKEGDKSKFVVVVLSGKTRVFVTRSGRELTLREPGPGSVVGELGVLCGIPRSASLRTLEESAILHTPERSFSSLLLGDPRLSHRIFSQLAQTLLDKERALIDAAVRGDEKAR